MSPKVSVVMPFYNAAPFLKEAIDSMLAQTFTDFELILINDGSTDTSDDIVRSYEDSRMVYLVLEKNQGLVNALNRGLDTAAGEYIARMDADDISLPARLEKQVRFLDQNPEVGVCGTAYRYFGDQDRTESPPQNHQEAFTYLAKNSSIGHPTALIRKSVLDRHGIRYEKEYLYAEDYAFWIKIGQHARLVSLPEPLLHYRWHAANLSKSDRTATVALARMLWFELLAGRPLCADEKKYFGSPNPDWRSFQASRRLFQDILTGAHHPSLDKAFFGQLIITDWELRLVELYGLKGLLHCFFKASFRKWSRATYVGLVAHYLATR